MTWPRHLAALLLVAAVVAHAAPAPPPQPGDWPRWSQQIEQQPGQALQALQALDSAGWPPTDRLRHGLLQARALMSLGRVDEAGDLLRTLQPAVQASGLVALQAQWSAFQGGVLRLQGRADEAPPHWSRGLELARQAGDAMLQSMVYTQQVEYHLDRRDIPAAAAALENNRRVAMGGSDLQLQAQHLYWSANLELDLDNLATAAQQFQQAAERFRTLQNPTWESDCLRLLGAILVELGRAPEAVTVTRQAAALLADLDDPMYLAMTQTTLALGLASLGRHDEALPLSSRAMATPALRQTPAAYLEALLRHARVLLLSGQRMVALQVLEDQVRPLLPPGSAQPAPLRRFEFLRAQTLSALGRAPEAEQAWRRVLELDRANFDRVLAAQLQAQRGVLQAQRLQTENELLQSRTATAERALQAETRLRWLVSLGVLVLAGSAAAALLWQRRVNRRIAAVAASDALTGLANRRSAITAGRAALAAAQRLHEPLAVLMLDVDHFKQVNDRHGHAAGDEVLRQVATALRQGLRRSDHLARWGGEEFLLLLPATAPAEAAALAERQRAAVAAVQVQVAGEAGQTHMLHVTLSVGVAALQAGDTHLDGVIARADAALYEAKRLGRNRVVTDAGL